MILAHIKEIPDSALQDFDQMMIQCALHAEKVSSLAMLIWGEALKELEARGLIKLISGSFDDIGSALITRHP